jgi:cell wall-associated NlpC family hydrolase
MKLIARALALLVALPGLLSAQVSLSLPRLSRPAVRATLGPIGIVATVRGTSVTVRAATRVTRRTPVARAPRTEARAGATAAKVLATAQRYLGTRYLYGGDTPGTGFDCSGFVQYVFGRHGVALPRTSRQQATAGRRLPEGLAALEPGDLILFSSKGLRIDHVAIYVGNNRILHSTAGAGGVVYDDLTGPRGKWYLARRVESRRVL